MKKRIGWILLAVLAPILVIFSLTGVLNTFRGTPIQRLHIAGTGDTRLEVGDSAFLMTAELLTRSAPYPGESGRDPAQ